VTRGVAFEHLDFQVLLKLLHDVPVSLAGDHESSSSYHDVYVTLLVFDLIGEAL